MGVSFRRVHIGETAGLRLLGILRDTEGGLWKESISLRGSSVSGKCRRLLCWESGRIWREGSGDGHNSPWGALLGSLEAGLSTGDL